MRFSFDEDQSLFQNALRDFLRNEHTPERVRALWDTETGRSPELWKKLAELGVTGLRVPEEYQGLGLDEIDFVLLLEEAGRAGLAEPLVPTSVVGVALLVELGAKELCEQWLKQVAVGEAILAVGHEVSPFVSDAHVADLLLLQHGDEVHGVARDAVELERQVANDPSRRIFTVRWRPAKDSLLAEGEQARKLLAAALDRGVLACAAQQLGVAEQLLEMAVAYASQRKQFGRPIGSFQAVQHALANIKVKLEYARPVVYRAAHSVAHGTPQRGRDVSMAKLAASESAKQAAKVALQVHGAIGYTWEQDLRTRCSQTRPASDPGTPSQERNEWQRHTSSTQFELRWASGAAA
jgi:alkylation response protein AidB-like acyl-CoA dehydrogenase